MGAFKSAGLVSLGLSFNSTKITKLLWALARGLETTKGGLSVLSEDTKGPVVCQARLKYCQCQSDLSRSVCWPTHTKKCAQLLAFHRGNSLFNKTNIWPDQARSQGRVPSVSCQCWVQLFQHRWLTFSAGEGGTCVLRLRFILLIGSGSLKPRLPRTAPQQPYSGSQSGHVWRQMESESVSGLPEMSLTSAAHKESGHRRSGITRWKKRGKKEESVRNRAQLSPLWPRGEREPSSRPEKPKRQVRLCKVGWNSSSAT